MLLGAALTEETAEWIGGWADGLITVAGPDLGKVIAAFRRGGGEGKRVVAQAKLSWDETEDSALASAMDQWRANVFPSSIAADVAMPEEFERLSAEVTPDQIRKSVHVSPDPEAHVERIRAVRALGVDQLYLHNVGRNQHAFIETFGRRVLPRLGS